MESVDRIVGSKSFGNSKTYENLLRYLVDCTLSGEIPKEVTIATDIFGKQDFDPSESTLVRVYVYNLRKKLAEYYKQEGKGDDHRLEIPKGSYKVFLLDKEKVEAASTKSNKSLYKFFWLLVALLCFSLILNLFQLFNNEDKQAFVPQGIWQDLADSKLPTMLVLGDLFVYHERDSVLGKERIIRDADLNSLGELELFVAEDPRKNIEIYPTTFALLIRNSAIWIKSFTERFVALDKDFVIRGMSRFNPKELQDNDIIVMGMVKTMGLFHAYFQNSSIGYEYPNHFIVKKALIKQPTPERLGPSGNPDEYHTDYAIVAKFPGPNNNTVYLLGGLWDTGASLSVKYFTDQVAIKELESALTNKYGYLPTYFEVLFKVNGLDRMEIGKEILFVNELDADMDIWNVKDAAL